jgi:tetratricopeptide (TPR) repeat protein
MHDTPSAATSPSPPEIPTRMLLAVWLVAAVLRLLHNQAMLADPLYFNPLGGNLPYLLAAEAIAGGDLVPFDGPISLNSPLYPYLLAGLYEALGTNAFYGVRVITGLLDAGTCALVALLAWRHFGPVAGWAGGMALALYGPMIFFAADLNPVPFTLFFLTSAVLVLDRAQRPRGYLAAGLLFGLTAATRPNVLLAGLASLLVPWVRRSPKPAAAMAALAVGLALGVAPVTTLNVAASGEPVLLTTGAGHNFYIGHNPEAKAQYSLPASLDGDIFASMKALAEDVEGRPFDDTEVSGWYLRRALAHMAANPGRELELLGRRALLLVNDFEATTYASFEYQREYSGILRWSPTFLVLFALAAPGVLRCLSRERIHLWIPLLTAAATVLLFFYIARLRVVMVPSLGVFAGVGVAAMAALARERAWRRLTPSLAVAILAAGLAALPLLRSDTSNEWNKAGGVLRMAGEMESAETAFERAGVENPSNPNVWLNLASLYEATGRTQAADTARARAEALLDRGGADAEAYRRALDAGRP